jgi:CHASE3 domain sensor protein
MWSSADAPHGRGQGMDLIAGFDVDELEPAIAGHVHKAEAQARQILTVNDAAASWEAAIVVVRALRAQEREAEAQALMPEYGIDGDVDLDDVS